MKIAYAARREITPEQRYSSGSARGTALNGNAGLAGVLAPMIPIRRMVFRAFFFYSWRPMLLQDRVGLINGYGRGIGRAIARLFAKEGACVFLAARTEKELAATVSEIGKDGGRAAFVAADLAEETDCKRLVSAARGKFGKIDILVNNAGHYGPVVPVEEYPLAEFDKVIAVHLRAAFLLSKLVLPEMYERRSGVILNLSSLSAKAAFSWGPGRAAEKPARFGWARGAAAEAARRGVRVNAWCPGRVNETQMAKELGAALAKKMGVSREEHLSGFLSSWLQGRAQPADEI